MRRAALLHCADIEKKRFELLQSRGQLPMLSASGEGAKSGKWAEYTMDDAFRVRLFLDLVGGEVEGKDQLAGLPPSYALKAVENAMTKDLDYEPFNQATARDQYIAVLILREDYDDGSLIFSRFYSGGLPDFGTHVAELEHNEGAKVIRVAMANATRAANFVRARAEEMGVS